MSMVSFVLAVLFKKVYFLFWNTLFFLAGSLANEPSLLSDFGLACFLGLYEEVKKACYA